MAPSLERAPQHGAAVWRTADVADADEWCVELTDAQRIAIVTAAQQAISAGITLASMRREDFPLPGMTDVIEAWSAALEHGRGFLLLRRFPIDLLDPDATELAYAGLGSHLGRPVGQNKDGELLTHIRDERLPAEAGTVRLYRTRQRQDFHTDAADVIGLLCLHRAREGGESRIVSSGAVYNEMLRTRPDLVEALSEPVGWDRQGDIPAGERAWFMLAPITEVNGAARLFYVGWYIRDAQRHPEVPRLTAAQIEAMELLESIANDPTFHLEMGFQPGDVQLLNNGRILHAREAYEDDDDPAERRHLLRLWLAAHTFASLEDGLRTGIANADGGADG
jgi:hypothetical protein